MKKTVTVLIAVCLIILLCLAISPVAFQLWYSTGYEGPKAYFYGIDYNGFKYTNDNRGTASITRFDTFLNFDPDDKFGGMCDLAGECTSIFVPERLDIKSDWVPENWIEYAKGWTNPRPLEWSVQDPNTGEYHFYSMQEWLAVWFCSISAHWSSGPGFGDDECDKFYKDTYVWFKFDLQPIWYFESQPTNSYFAIAKISLVKMTYQARLPDGSLSTPRSDVTVIPESEKSALTLYHCPFFLTPAPSEEEFIGYYYQKRKLNPMLFRPCVYSYIVLKDFGVDEWWVFPWTYKCSGDVATFMFEVRILVVGEWIVKDLSALPNEYGRMAKLGVSGFDLTKFFSDLFSAIAGFFSNPFNVLFFLIILFIVVFLLLAIFAPGVLIALSSVLKALFERRKEKGGV